jgi:putative hemolysin
MKHTSTLVCVVCLMILTACGGLPEPAVRQVELALDMANPASENCVEQGGEVEIRDEGEGQVGYCLLPDGSQCEEWAFFRGECAPGGQGEAGMANPASEYCVQQGGELEIRDEEGGQVGYCLFPDGSECEEWAFMRGECAPDGTYEPLEPEACIDLVVVVQETYTLDAELDRAPFDDYIAHITGDGCQATAVGSGYDFGSLEEASAMLGVLLESRDWQEDARYKADGPAATATAYRRENALCLAVISWEPAEGIDCPDDQPLAACELTPDEQMYTAALNCAQRAAEPSSP